MKKVLLVVPVLVLACFMSGCGSSSDQIQSKEQDVLLSEATSQVGMPAIKNFRERKLMKDILELRDQKGLVTYTYLENELQKVVSGRTALGGKLTFLGETVGYGLPYSTQFTNPEHSEWHSEGGTVALPQADPNGLFSGSSSEGTWVMMLNPTTKQVVPLYIEPRIVVSPFKFPMDK